MNFSNLIKNNVNKQLKKLKVAYTAHFHMKNTWKTKKIAKVYHKWLKNCV